MCSKRKYQFLWEKTSIIEVTFEALRSEKNKPDRINLKFAVRIPSTFRKYVFGIELASSQ